MWLRAQIQALLRSPPLAQAIPSRVSCKERKCQPPAGGKLCRSAFREPVELNQPMQQAVHVLERDHVRSIGGRLVRILMGLDENTGDADRDSRARQHADKLPLASRGCALPARLLDGMSGIKDDWRACAARED